MAEKTRICEIKKTIDIPKEKPVMQDDNFMRDLPEEEQLALREHATLAPQVIFKIIRQEGMEAGSFANIYLLPRENFGI